MYARVRKTERIDAKSSVPLYTGAESNLRVWGEGKKIALLLCQPKEDTAGSCLKKLCDLLREDSEKFCSNGSKRE